MNFETLLICYVYQMAIVVVVLLRSLLRMLRVERKNKHHLRGLRELRKLQDHLADLISEQEEFMKHGFDENSTLIDRTWEITTLKERIKQLEQSLG